MSLKRRMSPLGSGQSKDDDHDCQQTQGSFGQFTAENEKLPPLKKSKTIKINLKTSTAPDFGTASDLSTSFEDLMPLPTEPSIKIPPDAQSPSLTSTQREIHSETEANDFETIPLQLPLPKRRLLSNTASKDPSINQDALFPFAKGPGSNMPKKPFQVPSLSCPSDDQTLPSQSLPILFPVPKGPRSNKPKPVETPMPSNSRASPISSLQDLITLPKGPKATSNSSLPKKVISLNPFEVPLSIGLTDPTKNQPSTIPAVPIHFLLPKGPQIRPQKPLEEPLPSGSSDRHGSSFQSLQELLVLPKGPQVNSSLPTQLPLPKGPSRSVNQTSTPIHSFEGLFSLPKGPQQLSKERITSSSINQTEATDTHGESIQLKLPTGSKLQSGSTMNLGIPKGPTSNQGLQNDGQTLNLGPAMNLGIPKGPTSNQGLQKDSQTLNLGPAMNLGIPKGPTSNQGLQKDGQILNLGPAMNLGIPKGPTSNQGLQKDGQTLNLGPAINLGIPKGPTSNPGPQKDAQTLNLGKTINFGLPKGPTSNQGLQKDGQTLNLGPAINLGTQKGPTSNQGFQKDGQTLNLGPTMNLGIPKGPTSNPGLQKDGHTTNLGQTVNFGLPKGPTSNPGMKQDGPLLNLGLPQGPPRVNLGLPKEPMTTSLNIKQEAIEWPDETTSDQEPSIGIKKDSGIELKSRILKLDLSQVETGTIREYIDSYRGIIEMKKIGGQVLKHPEAVFFHYSNVYVSNPVGNPYGPPVKFTQIRTTEKKDIQSEIPIGTKVNFTCTKVVSDYFQLGALSVWPIKTTAPIISTYSAQYLLESHIMEFHKNGRNFVHATFPIFPSSDYFNSEAKVSEIKDNDFGIIQLKGGSNENAFRFSVLFHRDQIWLRDGQHVKTVEYFRDKPLKDIVQVGENVLVSARSIVATSGSDLKPSLLELQAITVIQEGGNTMPETAPRPTRFFEGTGTYGVPGKVTWNYMSQSLKSDLNDNLEKFLTLHLKWFPELNTELVSRESLGILLNKLIPGQNYHGPVVDSFAQFQPVNVGVDHRLYQYQQANTLSVMTANQDQLVGAPAVGAVQQLHSNIQSDTISYNPISTVKSRVSQNPMKAPFQLFHAKGTIYSLLTGSNIIVKISKPPFVWMCLVNKKHIYLLVDDLKEMDTLMVNAVLINEDKPVQYMATLAWCPERHSLTIQESARLEISLNDSSIWLHRTVKLEKPKIGLLRNAPGKVIKLLDDSFGLLEVEESLVLFDTCDVWSDPNVTLVNTGIPLSHFLFEGTDVFCNATLVKEFGIVQYLATAVWLKRDRYLVMVNASLSKSLAVCEVAKDKLSNYDLVEEAVAQGQFDIDISQYKTKLVAVKPKSVMSQGSFKCVVVARPRPDCLIVRCRGSFAFVPHTSIITEVDYSQTDFPNGSFITCDVVLINESKPIMYLSTLAWRPEDADKAAAHPRANETYQIEKDALELYHLFSSTPTDSFPPTDELIKANFPALPKPVKTCLTKTATVPKDATPAVPPAIQSHGANSAFGEATPDSQGYNYPQVPSSIRYQGEERSTQSANWTSVGASMMFPVPPPFHTAPRHFANQGNTMTTHGANPSAMGEYSVPPQIPSYFPNQGDTMTTLMHGANPSTIEAYLVPPQNPAYLSNQGDTMTTHGANPTTIRAYPVPPPIPPHFPNQDDNMTTLMHGANPSTIRAYPIPPLIPADLSNQGDTMTTHGANPTIMGAYQVPPQNPAYLSNQGDTMPTHDANSNTMGTYSVPSYFPDRANLITIPVQSANSTTVTATVARAQPKPTTSQGETTLFKTQTKNSTSIEVTKTNWIGTPGLATHANLSQSKNATKKLHATVSPETLKDANPIQIDATSSKTESQSKKSTGVSQTSERTLVRTQSDANATKIEANRSKTQAVTSKDTVKSTPAISKPSCANSSNDQSGSKAIPAISKPSSANLSLDQSSSKATPTISKPSSANSSHDQSGSKATPVISKPTSTNSSLDQSGSKATPTISKPSSTNSLHDQSVSKKPTASSEKKTFTAVRPPAQHGDIIHEEGVVKALKTKIGLIRTHIGKLVTFHSTDVLNNLKDDLKKTFKEGETVFVNAVEVDASKTISHCALDVWSLKTVQILKKRGLPLPIFKRDQPTSQRVEWYGNASREFAIYEKAKTNSTTTQKSNTGRGKTSIPSSSKAPSADASTRTAKPSIASTKPSAPVARTSIASPDHLKLEKQAIDKCPMCSNSHHVSECEKFISLNRKDRIKTADKFQLCHRCLLVSSENHSCQEVCTVLSCKGPHHARLHDFTKNRVLSLIDPVSEKCFCCGMIYGYQPYGFICPNFVGLEEDEKYKLIEKHNLCQLCLRTGHTSGDCMIKKGTRCDVDGCNKFHHPILHKVQNLTKCILCGSKSHLLRQCQTFKSKHQSSRLRFAIMNKLCHHCLGENHRKADCTFQKGMKCMLNGCNETHHFLLHTAQEVEVIDVPTDECLHCNQDHSIITCQQFFKLKPTERKSVAKDKGLCYHCLFQGHPAALCTKESNKKCLVAGCQMFHNPLLHPDKPEETECCICCEEHDFPDCQGFAKMATCERLNLVKSNNRCRHCLRKGHTALNCDWNQNQSCGLEGCQLYHHKLICFKEIGRKQDLVGPKADSCDSDGQKTKKENVQKDPKDGAKTLKVENTDNEIIGEAEAEKKSDDKKPKKSDDSDSDVGPRQRNGGKRKEDSEDESSDDETLSKKRKRKRIKKAESSSSENDEDLSESTKEADKVERERQKRMEERQKLFDKKFELRDDDCLKEVALDFDPVTEKILVQVDKKLVEKMKPHQARGIKFMWDACFETKKDVEKGKVPGGAILAHCMGLGKTLQTISLVHTVMSHFPEVIRRVLILCPVNTIKNWVEEFQKWLSEPMLEDLIEVHDGSISKEIWERIARLNHWVKHGGCMIMGYNMYRNLTSTGKRYNPKQKRSLQAALVNPGPDIVICDEGHILMNTKSALSIAVNKISTRRRIILTGTPLQNNLAEYFSMVDFVKPKLLGSYNEFKNRFVNPIQNGQHSDSTEREVRVMKKRSFILCDLLKGCMQRLDYNVLVPYLQPKYEYVLCLCLTDLQKKLYSYYLENYARAGQIGDDGKLEGGKKGGLFYDVQNLSRIWNHPCILEKAKERSDNERMFEDDDDDDFIFDGSDEEESTPGSTSNEDSDIEMLSVEGQSSKKDKKHLQKKNLTRGDRQKVGDEVTDLEAGSDEVKKESVANNKGWWRQFLTPSDKGGNKTLLMNIEHGSKMVLLMDILRECEVIGEKVLVFSQSLLSLDLIEIFLRQENEKNERNQKGDQGSWLLGKDYFRLDGSTAPEQRKQWCNSFNKKSNLRTRLFLISTKAGGLGINLVSANRVIIFDASWNPAHDVQSIFRVYRFGQDKPVYIYRFLAKGTMEEIIYDRQVRKQSMSARVVDEQQIERHFSMNELAELYQFNDEPIENRPVPNIPKDRVLAELLTRHSSIIWKYHDHDTLLENQVEENLTEEERRAAWEEFENERKGLSTIVENPSAKNLVNLKLDPIEIVTDAKISNVKGCQKVHHVLHSDGPKVESQTTTEPLQSTTEPEQSSETNSPKVVDQDLTKRLKQLAEPCGINGCAELHHPKLHNIYQKRKKLPSDIDSNSKNSKLISLQTSTGTCPVCKAAHILPKCRVFMGYSLRKRLEVITEKRLCQTCLEDEGGETCQKTDVKICNVKGCQELHHFLLHSDGAKVESQTTTEPVQSSETNSPKVDDQDLTKRLKRLAEPCGINGCAELHHPKLHNLYQKRGKLQSDTIDSNSDPSTSSTSQPVTIGTNDIQTAAQGSEIVQRLEHLAQQCGVNGCEELHHPTLHNFAAKIRNKEANEQTPKETEIKIDTPSIGTKDTRDISPNLQNEIDEPFSDQRDEVMETQKEQSHNEPSCGSPETSDDTQPSDPGDAHVVASNPQNEKK